MSQKKIEKMAEQSDMSEEEVREFLANSSLSASDVSSWDVTPSDLDPEDERVEEAEKKLFYKFSSVEEVKPSVVYDVCEDLGIRYMTDEIHRNIVQELKTR